MLSLLRDIPSRNLATESSFIGSEFISLCRKIIHLLTEVASLGRMLAARLSSLMRTNLVQRYTITLSGMPLISEYLFSYGD